MSKDKLYHQFVSKWEEVTELPPQTVGPLTPIYKRTVPYLKTDPWRIMAPAAFISAVGIALLLEITAVQIATILQRGF